MARHKSALKRQKQNETRRLKNQSVRSRLRTLVKKVRSAADSGDAETAKTELLAVSRALEKAASKGILHQNAASRTVSRLSRRVAGLPG